ncbi:MAG: hypothetical protein ABI135_05425, partial [Rhodoferax sp.]
QRANAGIARHSQSNGRLRAGRRRLGDRCAGLRAGGTRIGRIDAAKIHAGIAMGMQQMADRGWAADLCLVPPDASATDAVKQRLVGTTYDAVVIGGGIRIPPKSLLLFERMVNAVHQGAPFAAIAFNTSPLDTADAAARWFGHD